MVSGASTKCKRRMRILLTAGWPLLALSLVPHIQGCAATVERFGDDLVNPLRTGEYSAEVITGRVVDEETGRSLENVVVVAVWELLGGLEGLNVLGAAQVLETSTDIEGQYRIPAWGPLEHTGRGRLDPQSPKLLFVRQGYKFTVLQNLDVAPRPAAPHGRRSIWSGKSVALRNLKDDTAALHESFRALQSALRFVEDDEQACHWTRIPRTIQQSMLQARELSARRVSYLSEIGAYLLANDAVIQKRTECGSPRRFVEALPR